MAFPEPVIKQPAEHQGDAPMDSLRKALVAATPSFPIKQIFAGPIRSFALSDHGGVASTVWPLGSCGHGDSAFFSRPGLTTDEAAQKLFSDQPFDASLAMAAINSALPTDGLITENINARDLIIREASGGVLGLIGHFCFLEKFRPHFADILVFELNPQPGDIPASEIPTRLREVDVVAVTGTTLINGTIDTILDSVRPDARIVMLGPSTPLAPVLLEHGIHAICGTVVDDPEVVARNAMLAGSPHDHCGTRQIVLTDSASREQTA